MKFSSSVVINATPEKVFALVDNLEEWPQWIPSIKRIEKLSDGPLKEGSQIRVTAKSGVTVKLLMTITEFVPGQRGVMQGKVLGVRMTRYYTFESVEGGTKLTAPAARSRESWRFSSAGAASGCPTRSCGLRRVRSRAHRAELIHAVL